MSHAWYYVKGSERVGPINLEEIQDLIKENSLTEESYLWRKGFSNWEKLKNIEELKNLKQEENPDILEDFSPPNMAEEVASQKGFNWQEIDTDKDLFFIKIGADRGTDANEYGPFSIKKIHQLFSENRINGKTLIFSSGMDNWGFLAETPLYQEMTQAPSPQIKEEERRGADRKPFVAKLMFHDNKLLYEGVCRDISIGGLQILVSDYPGKVGDRISLNVHPENGEYNFVARGKIVRILEGGKGLSIRFVDLTEDSKDIITKYLEKYDG